MIERRKIDLASSVYVRRMEQATRFCDSVSPLLLHLASSLVILSISRERGERYAHVNFLLPISAQVKLSVSEAMVLWGLTLPWEFTS
jgi:hypothetical protein